VEEDDGADSTRTVPAAPPRPHAPPTARDGFLELVNSARSAAGSAPVAHDARLARAARDHAALMARGGRLGVEGVDGVSVHQRVVAAGYAYLTVGERLVSGPRTVGHFLDHCLRHEA